MIMDGGNADAGETDERALLGRRAGLLSRRSFLIGSAAGVGALGLAGCATSDGMSLAEARQVYGPVPDEKFPIPAIDVGKVDPKYFRRTVRYDTKEAPGTIIVDTGGRRLLYVLPGQQAYAYPISVGRDGFTWTGTERISRIASWPSWTPPPEMRQLLGAVHGNPDAMNGFAQVTAGVVSPAEFFSEDNVRRIFAAAKRA